MARLAWHLAHVRLVILLHLVGIGLVMPAHQRAHHAFETGGILAHAPPTVAVRDLHLEITAIHDGVARVLGQILPRRVQVEAHLIAESLKHMAVVFAGAFGHAPRFDGVLVQRLVRIGNDQFGVDFQLVSDTRAFRAGAIRRVEGEGARFDLVEFQLMAVRAGAFLGERLATVRILLVQIDEIGDDHAFGKLQRRFDGIGQTLADTVLDHQTIHHHFDGVLLLLGELDVIGQLPHLTVDQRTCVTIATQQFEQILEFALAAAHDRRENLETRAFRILQQRVHHLLRCLRAYQGAAFRTMRNAGAGEQQSQIIIDLGDCADRRTRIAVRGLLVDRNRGAQPLDEVDVRLVHLPQKLARVRRQRFDIPALALGEQRIERQRGFARTRQAGEHHHAVARKLQVHVLEIVLASALDGDFEVVG